jgi:Mannosylglycerate hydrolase MGH1-like glycoside hydrolase domain
VDAEKTRLLEAASRAQHWRRWGPFLSDREWGTVREDYSADGTAWEYFPFEHAHLRVYRWGEDGIGGISDNHQRLCFAPAFWNGRDPILKERFYGLTGNQGNHGEDVKEIYYYLDSTPTHSYMKCLYKYPQAEFPYAQLYGENRRRTRKDPEFELIDTGIFDSDRYFDIQIEYAKCSVDDILIRISVTNRGPERACLHLLPTLWFRNTWSWKQGSPRPLMKRYGDATVDIEHESLGSYQLTLDSSRPMLFTENESNARALWGLENNPPYVKDAFHRRIVHNEIEAVNPAESGTKACAWYQLDIGPGETQIVRMRLAEKSQPSTLVHDIDGIFARRIAEADEFYSFCPAALSEDGKRVQRQAFAGLLWSKQYYHFVVNDWLKGDPTQPTPPRERLTGRDSQWIHLFNEDVLSMPDTWEYPWYAAWDLSFHMIAMSLVDPDNAKSQLKLFLREWYMHPNGQIPAYEWAFGDVNPPVHAWACWRVFQIDRKLSGRPDYAFLETVFHKLLLNFTWWVNRKDSDGSNIFEGGFLGLDNIGVFDRSAPLPTGGRIEQSDGTSWMAMYCLNMMKIALELTTKVDPLYEDVASKFFEHFLYIAHAMNEMGDGGLWDETDGFFYDSLHLPDGSMMRMRVRSMVGLIPLFAVDTIEPEVIAKLSGFQRRMDWFTTHRPDLCGNLASLSREGVGQRRLLSVVPRARLVRVIERMLSEAEFLSPYGLRSLSKFHDANPYKMQVNGQEYRVDYEPAESRTGLFGGNSNWRGPIWFPLNFLLIESLQKFHYYFGDDLKVEFPTGSGNHVNLSEVATLLSKRLSHLFLQDGDGHRPVFGGSPKFQNDPHFKDNVLFYEYFHGDNGAGIGANHQTGWTALVAKLLQQSGE